jgi:glycosyltransferase involved in cell wall biosynthesis
MGEQPLISVITAFYNGGAFLAEAIQSVRSQSYSHWEYWLVNDGSTDGSPEIARQAAAADPERIHYLEHPGAQNRGACSSRNLALTKTTGKYLALLDADDFWFPYKLAEQVALAEEFPQARLIYGRSEYWLDWSGAPADDGKNHIPDIAPGDRIYAPPELLRICYPLGTVGAPCPSDMLIEREHFLSLGAFEESFNRYQSFEDQAFLAKLYLSAPVYVSNRCWDRYRVHADSCCAVELRTGQSSAAREFYFEWLRNLLNAKNVSDPTIWKSWRRETLCYRLPLIFPLVNFARRVKRRLTNLRKTPSSSSRGVGSSQGGNVVDHDGY